MKLLTTKEAADLLRQKPDFVRDLVRRGVIKGYAIGGPVRRKILIAEAELEAYLKSCEVKPPPKPEPRKAKPASPRLSVLERYASGQSRQQR